MNRIRWIIAFLAAAALWAWSRMQTSNGSGFTPIQPGTATASDRSTGTRANTLTQWRNNLSEALSEYQDEQLSTDLSGDPGYVTQGQSCNTAAPDFDPQWALGERGLERWLYSCDYNAGLFGSGSSYQPRFEYDALNAYHRELLGLRDATVAESGTQFNR